MVNLLFNNKNSKTEKYKMKLNRLHNNTLDTQRELVSEP